MFNRMILMLCATPIVIHVMMNMPPWILMSPSGTSICGCNILLIILVHLVAHGTVSAPSVFSCDKNAAFRSALRNVEKRTAACCRKRRSVALTLFSIHSARCKRFAADCNPGRVINRIRLTSCFGISLPTLESCSLLSD